MKSLIVLGIFHASFGLQAIAADLPIAPTKQPIAASGASWLETSNRLSKVPLPDLMKDAERGEPFAQLFLSGIYLQGLGVAKDTDAAIGWLQKAAAQDCPPAQAQFGLVLETGAGTATNLVEAVRLYQLAAKAGNAFGQTQLGKLHRSGRGVAKDEAEAARLFRLAAESGDANAQFQLAFCLFEGTSGAPDKTNAFAWALKAARQGLRAAQYQVGWYYREGHGVAKNDAEAIHWCRLAAENGFPLGQLEMGHRFENGRGVEKNLQVAADWYRKAADQGSSQAEGSLGYFFLKGLGVETNHKEALRLLTSAAGKGNLYSMCNLGWMHWKGLGTVEDLRQAQKWFLTGAEKEHAASEYMLGRMITEEWRELGYDVTKKEFESRKWYERAAGHGNTDAMEVMASFSNRIPRTEESHAARVKWLTMAVEHGSLDAVLTLGETLSTDDAVVKADYDKAVQCYLPAATNENARVQYALSKLYLKRNRDQQDRSDADMWLRKAAKNRHPEAAFEAAMADGKSMATLFQTVSREEFFPSQYSKTGVACLQLGIAYEEGIGGPVDYYQALSLYWFARLGPEKDRAEATRRLARIYATKAIDLSRIEFEPWYYAPKTSEELDRQLDFLRGTIKDPEALFLLGSLFDKGRLVKADQSKAMDWFTDAAKAGSAEAAQRIGEIWHDGFNGTKKPTQGFRWYLKAATNGLPSGQLRVAHAYQDGLGTAKDPVEALAWWNVVKKTSQPNAADVAGFARLESSLTGGEKSAAATRAAQLELTIPKLKSK